LLFADFVDCPQVRDFEVLDDYELLAT